MFTETTESHLCGLQSIGGKREKSRRHSRAKQGDSRSIPARDRDCFRLGFPSTNIYKKTLIK